VTAPATVDAVYEPGSSVAVAGPSAWVVADVDPGHASVGACWAAVRRGAPVEDVLDALIAGGLATAPSFAVAQLQGGSWRVVVRGTGRAAVTVDGRAVQTVDALAGTTWTDTIAIGEVEDIELSVHTAAPTGGLVLPLTSGVLMAGRLRLVTTVPVDAPSIAATGGTGPPTAPSLVKASNTSPGDVSPADVSPLEALRIEPPLVEDPPETVAETIVEEDVPSYDHLFGATARPVDLLPPGPPVPAPTLMGWETLPPPVDPSPEPPRPASIPEPARPAFMPAPVRAELAAPAQPASVGLIASFPFAVGASAAAAALPAGPMAPSSAADLEQPERVQVADVAAGDEVLQTTDRASLLRGLASAGPSVLASRCPAGHLSPANVSLCRVCRAAVAPQEPVETPRPVLGALRLSTGDVVTLDRGVVLGRAPEAGDGERPHLVKVLSPSGDISRVHLEVVLEGWHVLVRDLGSTNGSTVTVPGEAPMRVRAHELVAIEPGTEVSLADEVSFRFEVTP
jgi:hypothetical protein